MSFLVLLMIVSILCLLFIQTEHMQSGLEVEELGHSPTNGPVSDHTIEELIENISPNNLLESLRIIMYKGYPGDIEKALADRSVQAMLVANANSSQAYVSVYYLLLSAAFNDGLFNKVRSILKYNQNYLKQTEINHLEIPRTEEMVLRRNQMDAASVQVLHDQIRLDPNSMMRLQPYAQDVFFGIKERANAEDRRLVSLKLTLKYKCLVSIKNHAQIYKPRVWICGDKCRMTIFKIRNLYFGAENSGKACWKVITDVISESIGLDAVELIPENVRNVSKPHLLKLVAENYVSSAQIDTSAVFSGNPLSISDAAP